MTRLWSVRSQLTPPPPLAAEPGAGQDPAQRYMAAHAEYLAVFARTHHFLMRGDGPLAFDMRHYVAIMVSTASDRPGSRSVCDRGTVGRRVLRAQFDSRSGHGGCVRRLL